MPQRNRRTLSALILTVALVPALPSPSQAAGLWDWDPARLAAQAWSWLEEPRLACAGGDDAGDSVGEGRSGDQPGRPDGADRNHEPASGGRSKFQRR